jgi:flagellar protein FlgJ
MENYIKALTNLAIEESQNNIAKLETKSKDMKKLKEVAKEFEAIFVKMLLNEMKKTVPKSDFLHGGAVEDIFEDMLYSEYSKKMVHNMNLGIVDKIVELYKNYL